MTEPSGRGALTSTTALALWIALAGHLLALLAAVTGSLPPHTVIAAAIASSIIAVTAVTELSPPNARAVATVSRGHVVAAVLMLAGLAPSMPWSLPVAGFTAAAALGLAGVMLGRHASTNREPRPLALAPRVAAIALAVQVLLQRWVASADSMSMSLRATIYLAIAALGVAQLASLSIVALRLRPRWAFAGLLAWAIGWVAITADLGALIVWSLGGPAPTASHQLRHLDAELAQILTTAGGLAIGAALIAAMRDARFRHSAFILLAGYAVFGVIAAISEHRIELAPDFQSIIELRKNRDLADAITAFALAGVLWLYWRRVVAPNLPAR